MENNLKKIGLVGCGTIGNFLAISIDKEFKSKAYVAVLYDINKNSATASRDKLNSKPLIATDVDQVISISDLVIEAASVDIAAQIALKALESKKEVLIMSSGGLISSYDRIFKLAEKNCTNIYIPSGAICGIDGLKSSSMGRIKSVSLTTRKPTEGLKEAPYIIKNKIDLSKINKETVIFEGNAKEAIQGFPKNINVSAILSIVGIGADRTLVKIVTNPEYKSNVHEIEVEAESGSIKTVCYNIPSPQNPKTSLLALFSAKATLQGILSSVKVGT